MAITVTAWNVYNAFSDPRRGEIAYQRIEKISPDVGLFDEAYDIDAPQKEELVESFSERFKKIGFQVLHSPYADPDHYGMEHGIMAICRPPVKMSVVRIESRDSIEMDVTDPDTGKDLHIIGVHFDHRYEDRRVAQARTIISRIIKGGPVVVGGDLNAMHGELFKSKVLRNVTTKFVVLKIPNNFVRTHLNDFTNMADGTALKLLEDAGLTDADPKSKSTMLSWLPLGQLDHFMKSPDVNTSNFKRHSYSRASDHRAISCTFGL